MKRCKASQQVSKLDTDILISSLDSFEVKDDCLIIDTVSDFVDKRHRFIYNLSKNDNPNRILSTIMLAKEMNSKLKFYGNFNSDYLEFPGLKVD